MNGQARQIQIHGGDIYRNRNVTDYSVNSNPLGPPDAVLEALHEHAGDIVHYPDVCCQELKEAIGRFEGVSSGEIICGNGAAELFFAAVLAVRPKKALVCAPSFAEYARALVASGADIRYYRLAQSDGYKVKEDILEEITKDIDMMFLCNPNNPTGELTDQPLLLKILDKCRSCGVLLVLDECFLDFLPKPHKYEMAGARGAYPNLLLIKAFTKIFCMPGLRLGYGISSDKGLLSRMTDVIQPWNVSVLAQACGVAALKDCKEYLEKTRDYVEKEKRGLIEVLSGKGCPVFGSKANYIFFQAKEGLYEEALKEGFLIRDCGNYEGLAPGYYRIAVRTKEENERMAAWLRRL